MNPQIPTDIEQRWEWIKYQLRRQGMTFVSLGKELNVSAAAPQIVKYSPYPRIERAIARKLGLAPAQIWPERWNADGTPSRRRPNRAESRADRSRSRAKHSDSNAITHRQISQEA